MGRRIARSLAASVLFCCLAGAVGPAVATTLSTSAAQEPAMVKRRVAGATTQNMKPTATIAAADDNIPGEYQDLASLGATVTIDDSLDLSADSDDVFSVWLMAGEVVSVELEGEVGTDFGLWVFGPGATDIYVDDAYRLVSPQGPGSDPLELSFIADKTGEYYINPGTWSGEGVDGGSGSYELSISVTRQDTQVQIWTSTGILGYGVGANVTGSVQGRFWDPDGDVYFYYSYDGMQFTPLSGVYYSGGEFSFNTGAQDRKTWYMVVLEGNASNTTNASTLVFGSRPNLSNPIAPATMYRRRAKKVYGYLRPQHTAGSYPVRIYKYRRVSGRWKKYGYVRAKASDFDSDTTKYSVSMKLPYKGRWRLRAYAPADSGHVSRWSSKYDYVTVK